MKDMALLARSGSSSSTVWIVRVSTVVILTELLMMAYVWDLPRFFNTISMKPCIELPSPKTHGQAYANYPPKRVYKNNGYLLISCNGGLNQMRAAICDMVTIASFLNVTLIVPELDKTSFWADPSEFKDIFDVDHFILSLRNNVRVTRYLPKKLRVKLEQGTVYSMPPVSWSNLSYYHNQVLPLIKKHKVVRLNKTDTRLANNGIPFHLQKLRCHVNYGALKFTSRINELGEQVIKAMRRKGFFIALHLRYEMDMLAFSGCTLGCSSEEAELLTGLRYAYPWWREKDINAESKRKEGQCPLTPEETALVLKAFDFDSNVPIYIASGEIFGGDRRMATLYSTFPNIVRKEMILSPDDIRAFKNHSSQMAAIDYLVSLASDVFIPTYGGNMAKVVEGHRRYLGYRKTIVLDRVRLVYLIDQFSSGLLGWKEFSSAVKKAHVNHTGSPAPRLKIPDKPKEEEYFYANPNECLSENTRQT